MRRLLPRLLAFLAARRRPSEIDPAERRRLQVERDRMRTEAIREADRMNIGDHFRG
jgi:hypothetical protein